jgi:hypothetical protein
MRLLRGYVLFPTSPSSLSHTQNWTDEQHLKSQSFTPSLLHPTVHLSLGYLSIIIGMGSYLWSMKMEFEESKYITWFGVSSYFILQGVIWGWKRWVERGEVFNGKRRRMVKRVSLLPAPTDPGLSAARLAHMAFKVLSLAARLSDSGCTEGGREKRRER